MPFKSEKQRRYLWANEPEIARDWTDTYGSGIHKAKGGRIGLRYGMSAWKISSSIRTCRTCWKNSNTSSSRSYVKDITVQQGTQHITGGSADLARQEQAAAADQKNVSKKLKELMQFLNKYVPGRVGQNTKLRGGYIDKFIRMCLML